MSLVLRVWLLPTENKMKKTRMLLIFGITMLGAACGGGGGGGSAGASNTGQTDDGVTGVTSQTQTEESVASDTSQTQTEESIASDTSQTEGGTPPGQSNIPWLFSKSTVRLNKDPGTSAANTVLNTLPNDYYEGRDALRAEASKSSPSATLFFNHGGIFGKNEGKAHSPNGDDHLPGTWVLATSCVVTLGSCGLNSEGDDAHHVVGADGRISPYFIGWYDRDGNGLRGAFCDGTNDYTCENKGSSRVEIEMTYWDSTSVQPIMTVNGIGMVQTYGTRDDRVSGAPFDFVGYGAWMEYVGFFAEGYLYDTADGRKQENTAWTFGVVTGLPSVPSGQTLRWEGSMAGMKGSQAERQLGDPYVERDFEAVQGDALVTAQISNDNLELMVALTDIFYLNPAESGSIPDIVWDNHIGVDDQNLGHFGSAMYNSNERPDLTGAFYGPNQEEVAGTFDWESGDDFIVGAFGARRVE